MMAGHDAVWPRSAMRASQFSLQHQGEEAAEHMAADGFVEPVKDRPRGQQVLGGAEGLLDAPELL